VLSRLLPDRFILWLAVTVLLGLRLPVAGDAAVAVEWLTYAAIFALFFLHGARLERAALIAGVTGWRLHAVILSITYIAFPLIGIALSLADPDLFEPMLWTGILFLCALPSTVQTSIAYTSIAHGNVAGAVAAAAFSNLLSVFLTPVLIKLMLEAQDVAVSLSGIGKIFVLLFLPFLLGHLARPLVFPLIAHRPTLTTIVDKGTILLAVYGAFSAATVDGVWHRIPAGEIVLLALVLLPLLATILALAWGVGRLGGFSRADRATILFCGSVKGLVSGVPMARILFPGAAAGIVIVPIMIYHAMQLVVGAWIAGTLGRKASETDRAPG
jgi:sodium/bile acid cotransporter 7